MRRRWGWMGLAALALLGGCAEAVPPPAAPAPVARGRAVPTRGVDCTTQNYHLFTTTSCGNGGFDPFAPATN